MNYSELLKTQKSCPFCKLIQEQVVSENDTMILTYALAPYTEDHMLVVSKRHIEAFADLAQNELADMMALQKIATKILSKLGGNAYSFLFREGTETGKSVPHIHLHIIPRIQLSSESYQGGERLVLLGEEEKKVAERLRNALL